MNASSKASKGAGGMGWVVALPLLLAFVMGTSTLVMALRSADVPVPGAVWKQGPIQFGNTLARERAAGAHLAAQLHSRGLALEISGLPPAAASQSWELLFWRAGDGGDDLRVALRPPVAPAQVWTADLPQTPGLRHEVLLRSTDGQYELVGRDPGAGMTTVELRP